MLNEFIELNWPRSSGVFGKADRVNSTINLQTGMVVLNNKGGRCIADDSNSADPNYDKV